MLAGGSRRASALRGSAMDEILRSAPILAKAFLSTLELSAATIVLAALVGVLVGELASLGGPVTNWVVRRYVDIVRGIPVLVFIFLIFYLLPLIGLRLGTFTSAVIALATYFSAFIAEIVRGAIAAIPAGQVQSGYALGMTRLRIEWYVIAPQAMRIALPPLLNQCAIAIKTTALASVIGVWELTFATREIVVRTAMPYQFFILLMVIYFCFCFSIVALSKFVERRLAIT